MKDEFIQYPHRRRNALTGEWVLVSPQRWERPWQGKLETVELMEKKHYDPQCYLCPGNTRANGETNPDYKDVFSFTNDFSALQPETEKINETEGDLFQAITEKGTCRVVCFSPDHNLTLAEMDLPGIDKVIMEWIREYKNLSSLDYINNIIIFENKGELMGNSNPHPHCQIWAQESIPSEIIKESDRQREYSNKQGECLLCSYLSAEQRIGERIVFENEDFSVLVPFWAVWPFETMIIGRRHLENFTDLSAGEIRNFSSAIKKLAMIYDKLFSVPFPYSSGIHQAPADASQYPEWHFHMHFYPPLLRSASVKKFMVGYELLGNPQRDLTPEKAAERLRSL